MMKNKLLAISYWLLASSLVFAPWALGQTFVQGAHCNSATSCAFPSNVGAHHLLTFVAGANDTGTTGWAPTGTNNSYTSAVLFQCASTCGTPRELQVFYTCNSVAGAETVTANPNTAPSYQDYDIAEYSGTATSSCLDSTKTGTLGTLQSGSYTVTSGDLIVGWGLTNASAGVGSGFTARNGTDGYFFYEDQLASGNSVNAVLTGGTGGDTIVLSAAFKASGSSSAAGFNKRRKIEQMEQ
jgi:hypothetical protein